MRHVGGRYIATILSVVLFSVLVIAFIAGYRDWVLLVTGVGTVLSTIYFLQGQRLEETKLFKELFAEFNRRYDNLNNKLMHILDMPKDEELNPEQESTLIDYFNLCSEEYLFYKLGYIREGAWSAWLAGMKIYYNDERIRTLWDADFKTGSYYGFSYRFLQDDA